MRYICPICGYVHDEAQTGVAWEDLPDTWRCPLCGAAKADFSAERTEAPVSAAPAPSHTDMSPLNAIETSALCTSLAKGCEKQYQPEQAQAFRKLAAWFGAQAEKTADPSFQQLLEKVEADLASGFPAANAAAKQHRDRGALRSLTWSEKVTRILKSLLERYAREGDAMLENTGVYVCTICGFVYVGDTLPEVCPVCKVPNRKFEKIGG